MDYSKYCVEAKTYEEALKKWQRGETVAKEREKKNNINVRVEGNKTIVTLGDGREGVAKCNPEDEFDIVEGVKVALEHIKKEYRVLTDSEKRIIKYLKECGCTMVDKTKIEIMYERSVSKEYILCGTDSNGDTYGAVLLDDNDFEWLPEETIVYLSSLGQGKVEEC